MNAVAVVERIEPESRQELATSPTPGELLRFAMSMPTVDTVYLRELMQLQRDWDANEARKEYVRAMAAFKADPPSITKDKLVSFETKGGGKTEYMHATIGNVVEKVTGALGKCGLSHRWDTKQGNAGQVEVTCTITHERGHSESTSLRAMEDTSGAKNGIQSLASTVTYLQRYTLLALTGLATKDGDDDGRSSSAAPHNDLDVGDVRPGESEDQKAARKKAAHDKALAIHSESIAHIKERLAAEDYAAAAAEWRLIPQDDQRALWVSTKVPGACFTTAERDAIKTKLPKLEPQA